ncbi:3,4-dihydroxy-2-butanone-4-phosphate synthase [Paralimibaculum aggregatum]|uniref:3,4-dihydroxy-2-butanone 4-phosphate synthase n=1 Tax=Paralimibaculum aggregatum TaxID=3036245 RepID=A0ABQ6LE97_9RHOB|nr:3,4-dihydroxy-2-butanone-4-phosphate synthase [Limibaculum sp. NKW23]GMG81675.1 3,4-dihydroxy-2-butanone-4-phosphate synthase [Limibaculum sp. NKW23]
MSDRTEFSDVISSVSEIIEEARNGRMVILVDHEDRENEGDLVIPAQMATPDVINFMATHGRGLICLAMEGRMLDGLGLPMMAQSNQSRHETAFTVSIEAREGVTTGISAHDRARTIAVAIDPRSTAADIATPGHVFPLRAREGGVLVRAGHTEAAVDLARLAGVNPSGVICEVMKDDGSMARLPDLVAFAQRHNLKIGTISDLIAYRRRHDNLVQEVDNAEIDSVIGGRWGLRVFRDTPDGHEHYAVFKGDLSTDEPVLTRMHVLDPLEDVVALNPGRWQQVPDAMRRIAEAGRGVVVLLRDPSPTAISDRLRARGIAPKELRQYGLGAQILSNLGVSRLVLLTNSPTPKVVGLEGYGIEIVDSQPINGGSHDGDA